MTTGVDKAVIHLRGHGISGAIVLLSTQVDIGTSKGPDFNLGLWIWQRCRKNGGHPVRVPRLRDYRALEADDKKAGQAL